MKETSSKSIGPQAHKSPAIRLDFCCRIDLRRTQWSELLQKIHCFTDNNLPILRQYIADQSIDLIYLDPPFNSNRSYNVLFKDEAGKGSLSLQITAFDDTWHWGEEAEHTYHTLVQNASANVSTMISALRAFIGTNQMMAYLVMMTARLLEMHRTLKTTGSLYLHCDTSASHYLNNLVLDTIFGFENFRNEITWQRTNVHSDSKNME